MILFVGVGVGVEVELEPSSIGSRVQPTSWRFDEG